MITPLNGRLVFSPAARNLFRTVALDSIPVVVRNSLLISGAVTNLFLRATVRIGRSCLTVVFLSRPLPLLIVMLPVWRCNVTRREITLFYFPKNRATWFWDWPACTIPIACHFCFSVRYCRGGIFTAMRSAGYRVQFIPYNVRAMHDSAEPWRIKNATSVCDNTYGQWTRVRF